MTDRTTDSGTGRDTAEILRRHGEALEAFGRHVHEIRDDQWHAPTPCTDWTVRDLVNHLTAEQLWVEPLMDGATIAEVGDRFDGDVLGDDPVAAWDRASAVAREVFTRPGALDRHVHLSTGQSGAAPYCAQMASDAAIHAWDLARAIGADDEIPEGLVAFVTGEVEPYGDDLAASGMFAEPVPVPDDADPWTRLLALTGRRR